MFGRPIFEDWSGDGDGSTWFRVSSVRRRGGGYLEVFVVNGPRFTEAGSGNYSRALMGSELAFPMSEEQGVELFVRVRCHPVLSLEQPR